MCLMELETICNEQSYHICLPKKLWPQLRLEYPKVRKYVEIMGANFPGGVYVFE